MQVAVLFEDLMHLKPYKIIVCKATIPVNGRYHSSGTMKSLQAGPVSGDGSHLIARHSLATENMWLPSATREPCKGKAAGRDESSQHGCDQYTSK